MLTVTPFETILQRPVDVLHRKNMSATWFPYTAIERLWCQLEEMQNAGHSVDQCDRLKKLLHGSLISHLQQVSTTSNGFPFQFWICFLDVTC
jgi:nuclear pore complex protein Nup160